MFSTVTCYVYQHDQLQLVIDVHMIIKAEVRQQSMESTADQLEAASLT